MVPHALEKRGIVIHKIVAGRPRDIEDVKGILARPQNIDDSYIVKWLEEFGKALSRNLVGDYTSVSESRK